MGAKQCKGIGIMRNPNKHSWSDATWREYVQEASETAHNLERLGASSIVERWKQIAIYRESEYKSFVKPQIPYQDL